MTEKDEKSFMLALLFALYMYLLSRRYSLYLMRNIVYTISTENIYCPVKQSA